jgi:ATP:corrinoid adenosyltransferase
MSASKKKGTGWETAVVQFLKENGVPHAERRALNGTKDRGDIAGIPGVVIECKNERAVALAAYADETAAEAANDSAPIGLAWIKRRGKASPASGYVLLDGNTLIRLLADAGYIAKETTDG